MRISELNNQNLHWRFPEAYNHHDPDLSKIADSRIRLDYDLTPLEKGGIHLLLGPRQVGKTTFLKISIQKGMKTVPPNRLLYLSADALVGQEKEFRRAIDLFLGMNPDAAYGALYLDEITGLKSWPGELKRFSDQGVTRTFPVLATGSSAHELRRQAEQLPGRGLEGNTRILRPLNFRSFLFAVIPIFSQQVQNQRLKDGLDNLLRELRGVASSTITGVPGASARLLPFNQELQFLFTHYLVMGGYPRAVESALDTTRDRKIPSADVAEIFVRDVLGEVARSPRSPTVARHILGALLEREGQRCSFSAIADAIDSNHSTVIDHVEALEAGFLLHVLEAQDLQQGRPKPRSDRKFFFADPFLRIALLAHLRGQSLPMVVDGLLETEERLSMAVEATVASHLIQAMEIPYRRERWSSVGFAYDLKKREIDAVVYEEDGSRIGVEVKYRSNVRPGDVNRMHGLDSCLLLSREDFSLDDKDVPTIPVSLALATLTASKAHLQPRHAVEALDQSSAG